MKRGISLFSPDLISMPDISGFKNSLNSFMQFSTKEDFVMSSLGLCGEDWAVIEASKWAFSLCFKCHLEVGLVSMFLKKQFLLW